jgi:hypothetical protein
MPIFNRRQFVKLANIICVGIFPLSLIFFRKRKYRSTFTVIVIFILILLINSIDPYPSGPRFIAQNGAFSPVVSNGMNPFLIILKIISCFFLITLFFITFIVDLRYAIMGEGIKEITYQDKSISRNISWYYSVLILLFALVVRIIIVSMLFLIGLEAINIQSIKEFGYSIFDIRSAPPGLAGIFEKFSLSIDQPLFLWGAKNGPFILGDILLTISKFFRIFMITFLFGIYLNIIMQIKTSLIHPKKVTR